MIKTTHPISSDFIKEAATCNSDSKIADLAKVFDYYNNELLPKLLTQLPESVKSSFFEGDEQISCPDTVIVEYEKDEDSVLFNIDTIQYQMNQKSTGKILFTGVEDFKAEFDGSPVTQDYLESIIKNRMIYDVFFDKINDELFILDIYSFNEEEFEDGEDLDDVEILHIQFKFKSFSADLEKVADLDLD